MRGVSGRPAVAALVRSRPSGGDVLLALAIFAFGLIAASSHHGAGQALLYAVATVETLPLIVRCLFALAGVASLCRFARYRRMAAARPLICCRRP